MKLRPFDLQDLLLHQTDSGFHVPEEELDRSQLLLELGGVGEVRLQSRLQHLDMGHVRLVLTPEFEDFLLEFLIPELQFLLLPELWLLRRMDSRRGFPSLLPSVWKRFHLV